MIDIAQCGIVIHRRTEVEGADTGIELLGNSEDLALPRRHLTGRSGSVMRSRNGKPGHIGRIINVGEPVLRRNLVRPGRIFPRRATRGVTGRASRRIAGRVPGRTVRRPGRILHRRFIRRRLPGRDKRIPGAGRDYESHSQHRGKYPAQTHHSKIRSFSSLFRPYCLISTEISGSRLPRKR